MRRILIKIINAENKRADAVMVKFEGYLERIDAELEDIENKSEELEDGILKQQ